MKNIHRGILAAVLVGVFLLTGHSHQTNSLNLTSVSDTLSSSRLSFVARQAAGNTAGSDTVNIDTTQGAWESTSSANLFVNDPVKIGNGGSMGSYTVIGIPSTSQIQVNPVLSAGSIGTGQFIIATRSAIHTVTFTTASAVNNGAFRILIPAVSVAANAKDGIPDRSGFDFSTSTPSVTCPSNTANYGFAAGTATPSAVTIGTTTYHAFECRYAGTGAIGQTFSIVIGTSNPLINPAPLANHIAGTADQYKYIVQQTDNYVNQAAILDQTAGGLAVVESIRVTATVDPQITFAILGVNSSTSACSLTTSVATTPVLIPFGSVPINTFTIAAHTLSISTNATSGYTVTTTENDQLGRGGNACSGTGPAFANPCIADSPRDSGSRSISTGNAWATATANYGLAYTLGNASGTTINVQGTAPLYLDFADSSAGEIPQSIMSATGVANNHNAMVCYKISVGATQQAGDYTNNLTYTATATF